MILEKILLGITLAAPIGPVSLEIIRRGLTQGFLAALLISIGAIIGDGLCLGAAFLGLNALAEYAIISDVLGLVGAGFLLYLGTSNLKNRNRKIQIDNVSKHQGVVKSIILGFALAVVNPLSLVFWISIFAASTANMDNITFLPNSLILIGVFIWSVTLCSILTVSKNLLNKEIIKTIIVLSSLLLLFYGLKYGYISVTNILGA